MEKLKNLVILKEKPETTQILKRAIENSEKTISTYIFTPSIKEHFERILERVYQEKGGGWWIQAEYGAGKTHFLGALVCLLQAENENILNKIQEEEIKTLTRKILSKKFFPVILSLRGEASIEGKDNLLFVIEEAIEKKVDELGLQGKISITSEDEVINWYKNVGFKDKIDIFIKERTNKDASNISQTELAKLINIYCKENKIRPDITTNTKDRLRYIYLQLEEIGFDGMLFVIDEFAFWQDRHLQGTPEYAQDEEVLETIGWILPQELDLKIYTFVASQKEAPTKLKGDRFKKIELLGGTSEKDYEIIAANRVRNIVKEKIPEIEQYYEYYYKEFKFPKAIGKEFFYQIFPFHPKCFEILRKITERELPTERSAINIAYETLSNEKILQKDTLIILSDVINSEHLVRECLTTNEYNSLYENYKSAMEDISKLELDKDRKELANKIITTLFLYYCAYLRSTKPLSINDITELTLTTSDIIKGTDKVELVLGKLRDISQISYTKDKGAIFIPQDEEKQKPSKIFEEIKRKIPKEYTPEIQKAWEEVITLPTPETDIERSLFSGYNFDKETKITIEYNRIEYPGEFILARDIREKYYEKLQNDMQNEIHFRIVILTKQTQIEIEKIGDSRIAFCVPSGFSDTTIDEIRSYIAVRKMEEIYSDKYGSEFEHIKDWTRNKKKEVIRNLISTQTTLYKNGEIHTKQQLGFDTKRIFAYQKKIFQEIALPLLSNAYNKDMINHSQIKKIFSGSEARKVFEGLFKKSPSQASLSACNNFAVGLNLSTIENPKKFHPVNNSVFSIIENMLCEGEGEVSIREVYNLLQNPPYGLIKEIITLYLLCFVNHKVTFNNEEKGVEIILKPNNKLQIKSNKITSFNLQEIDWRTGIENDFDVLAISSEISWNEILNFAKIIDSSLKIASKAEEIIEQEKTLIDRCHNLGNIAAQIKDNLDRLARKLQDKISEDMNNCIDFFKDIGNINNRIEFYNKVKEKFGMPDEFKKSYELLVKLKKISDKTLRITDIINYLQQIIDSAEGEFKIKSSEILNGIKFAEILKNPNITQSIEDTFEKFKNAYKNKYQIHHRDFNKSTMELKNLLQNTEPKIKTIKYLCKIKELNIKNDVLNYYQQYLEKIKPCSEKDPVSVENSPFCNICKLKLADNTCEEEIKKFVNTVDKKLKSYSNNLLNILTEDVLLQDKNNKLQGLISAIKSSDTDKFMKLLTPDLIDYIKELINMANILIITVPVFAKIREKYTYIDEDNLEMVLKEFQENLKNEIDNAKRKNPGKKIRISLGGE